MRGHEEFGDFVKKNGTLRLKHFKFEQVVLAVKQKVSPKSKTNVLVNFVRL